MVQKVDLATFEAMFEELFTRHDANNNGYLEKAEARAMIQEVNAQRPDGHEFNEENFSKLFDEKAIDGKIPKANAKEMALKRGRTLGFIEE